MPNDVITFDNANDVDLVVSVLDRRVTVQVPREVVNDMNLLTRFLREKDLPVPTDPNLTKNDSGTYVLHEQPVFG